MQTFEIQYTDKAITPWGGMVLLKQMLDKIKFADVIRACDSIPLPGSNRGYDPQTIIESFIVSIWCGANRFLHTEINRNDTPLANIFGWKHAPGQDAFKRFFKKFSLGTNQRVFSYFYQWLFSQIKFDHYTVDFDSSVLTRYGTQEGAKRGYNPSKPGRNSHHPIMAFIADLNMVANFWLRSGDSHTANNFKSFLEETLSNLSSKTVGLVRMDSGFYDKEVFDYLENKSISYIVAARFYSGIQNKIADTTTWLKLSDGIEIASTTYQGGQWQHPRRMVIIRQHITKNPKATGKQLKLFNEMFEYSDFRYSAMITNLDLSAAEIWRLYRYRAEAENRIKELKYDFALDSFNLNNFYGTEAALGFSMLAYNLMSLFRQFILNDKVQHRLSTLRYTTFAIGAYLTKAGNKTILKLALRLPRREWFGGVWDTSKQFNLPVIFSNA